MAKKTAPKVEEAVKPRRGRPPKEEGAIGSRLSIVCSPEYRAWLHEFSAFYSQSVGSRRSIADVVRECVRVQAEGRGFKRPPLI